MASMLNHPLARAVVAARKRREDKAKHEGHKDRQTETNRLRRRRNPSGPDAAIPLAGGTVSSVMRRVLSETNSKGPSATARARTRKHAQGQNTPRSDDGASSARSSRPSTAPSSARSSRPSSTVPPSARSSRSSASAAPSCPSCTSAQGKKKPPKTQSAPRRAPPEAPPAKTVRGTTPSGGLLQRNMSSHSFNSCDAPSWFHIKGVPVVDDALRDFGGGGHAVDHWDGDGTEQVAAAVGRSTARRTGRRPGSARPAGRAEAGEGHDHDDGGDEGARARDSGTEYIIHELGNRGGRGGRPPTQFGGRKPAAAPKAAVRSTAESDFQVHRLGADESGYADGPAFCGRGELLTRPAEPPRDPGESSGGGNFNFAWSEAWKIGSRPDDRVARTRAQVRLDMRLAYANGPQRVARELSGDVLGK